MIVTYFENMVRILGTKNSAHRLDVMIKHLKKTMTTTDNDTASVVDDVINMLERIKSEVETSEPMI